MKARLLLLFTLALSLSCRAADQRIDADLLIVGGNESACAAAMQAVRLGVSRVVLVNDIEWLGGQFSAEGVGCLDEWTTVGGKRVNFPRSGLFREVVDLMRAYNSRTYGVANPGNAFCGTETIEPAAAARIFEQLLEPSVASGALRILRRWQPARAIKEANRVIAVEFESAAGSNDRLTVQAALTLDSSDWGDVIRLSGAKYGAGPDLRSRFGEPSAPESFDEAGRQEMNPLSWCIVLRETGGKLAVIEKPASYDARSFAALNTTPPWVDSDMSTGVYAHSGWSIYTHRRLVDRWHFGFRSGTEATFLNWPVQDYPLCQLPRRVVDELEATAQGVSRKNIVDLTPAQRRLIFQDAREHALGMLYHLQTAVHDRVGDFPQSFRYMALTDEFGTADKLPPKPYVREGLRLEALAMLREQDIRAASREPKWARTMAEDAAFGFQFNIDFHPTRRKFLTEDRNGPWQYIHTESRGWHTDTDRAVFPLRGLVPVEVDGLLGCGKNIGVSSVVQSALRLHGQMMHVGQASATVAWLALRENIQPRAIMAAKPLWRDVQLRLVRGCGGPGILLWPWQDLAPEDLHFEAANMLAVRGIWEHDRDSVFFTPEKVVTLGELRPILDRLVRAMRGKHDATGPGGSDTAQENVTWAALHRELAALGLPASPGLLEKERANFPLTRAECVRELWRVLRLSEDPGNRG
jgi:hypothetical protein